MLFGLGGAVLMASLALGSVQAADGQGEAPLEAVRQLYASADYEGALATIERVVAANVAAPVIELERYRALCLMALGRSADAEVVIEHIVRINPWFQPDEQEPPRVRAAFTSVRARVLPEVARSSYGEAKTAYDRRDYKAAVPGFERTIEVLDSIESGDPALADLRTLALGFLDLSRASIRPAPAPPPSPPAEAVPPAPDPAALEPPTQPVAIQQGLPPWNPAWFGTLFQSEFRGVVEVSIDESGAVVSARIVEPVHPMYDGQLLEAATAWRYEPARRGGKPVASSKRVEVVLRPRD